jgi:hypothetical protein
VQLCTVLDIDFGQNWSLKHVLLPAILGINYLFQPTISAFQIMELISSSIGITQN